jgi:hypothetical protein
MTFDVPRSNCVAGTQETILGANAGSLGVDSPSVTAETVCRFVTHSGRVVRIAQAYGWSPGARYTNLRDVRSFDRVGFLDIDWKNYNFKRHLRATSSTRPLLTVARDVEKTSDLPAVLDQAEALAEHADQVIIVPKDPALGPMLQDVIPDFFLLGYSVPSRYGGTSIPPSCFRRAVHLLGGRPDVQRRLANLMPVVSFDCNRFTLDAAFGDFFDGDRFRPHPLGGYDRCVEDSLRNINCIWEDYSPLQGHGASPGTNWS